MIRAVQIGVSGKPELIMLPDPMKDGWKALWADIGDRIEVSVSLPSRERGLKYLRNR